MLSAKFFYTTGSECTSSLAAVNACLSQSFDISNPYNLSKVFKYEVSSSGDYYEKHANKFYMNSSRMSEAYDVTKLPTIVFEYYGTSGSLGMEENRWAGETSKLKMTQDALNKVCAYTSASSTSL